MMGGCSGRSDTTSANEVPIVVTVHDAPATGTSVLDFQIQITGIALQESTGSSKTVNLLANPVTVNLTSLQTQSELLATTGAPAGTYSGVMITFANPSATVYNSSGSSFTVGGTACAAGTSCLYTPTLNQSSATITSSPFPLTLTKGSPLSLAIDFNVNNSLQSDSTVTPSVTVTATTTPLADGNLAEVSGVTGQVTKVGNNQFTITDSNTGLSQTFNVGSNTQFGTFTNCTASNFTCVKNGQLVSVNVGVGADGATLTASNVSAFNGFTQGVSGTVISKNANGTFNMVVSGMSPTLNGVSVGQVVTVNPSANATFAISGGETAPSGSTFGSISDVIPGQGVFVDSTGVTAATNGGFATLTADQVQLTPTEFTGTVGSLSSPNFTVNALNGFDTSNGLATVQVSTGTNTSFFNVAGNAFSGLNAGSTVNVGGFLFNSPNGPVFVGTQVGGVTTTASSGGGSM